MILVAIYCIGIDRKMNPYRFNVGGAEHINYVKAARPIPDGEMFTLSVRRQEYLMKVILYGLRCSAVSQTQIRQGSVS